MANTMTGIWATLTDEQKAAAIAYRGPENHGDHKYLKGSHLPMMDPEIVEQLRKIAPEEIAKELCSVQPIDTKTWPKDWIDDPLLNALLTRFVNRQKEKA